jgi:hypothetical protein
VVSKMTIWRGCVVDMGVRGVEVRGQIWEVKKQKNPEAGRASGFYYVSVDVSTNPKTRSWQEPIKGVQEAGSVKTW